ncbi:right-handed parallel beta-helix repeat-containing protein [Natranaeroarchaeum sulfidigenes]|uniref:Right handed beta helix domain-containing protein n=1 Tax=Natranaeroarchaeum sulfidigenes TaxID=2784880 RepID=A0A897MUA0_9EURY|nr:right-handed parallel beta-helix repeat-containing protein [Natranaeroarchaeum sulfidigenes]QSG02529.1 hypothetical protein AArcS_1312 [Natranaeroarchaeum sulfidigenes]
MTENNIQLVNEDGKIVGKNPETGETIPIELGETVLDSLHTDEVNTVRYVNPSMSAAEISAIIEEVSDAGGGTVVAVNGEYDPEDPIIMSDNVYFRGESEAGTVFRPTDGLDAVDGADFGRSVIYAEDLENIEFSHMTIDGTTDLNANYCIEPFNCKNVEIHHITGTNVRDDPLVMHRNTDGFGIYFCTTKGEFDDEDFGSHGIEIEEGSKNGVVAFNHCYERQTGIEVKSRYPGEQTQNVLVFGNYISGGTEAGIALTGDEHDGQILWLEHIKVFANTVENIGSEEATGVGIRGREYLKNCEIYWNTFRDCDHATRLGWINENENVTFSHNSLEDMQGDAIRVEGGTGYEIAHNDLISASDGYRIGIRLNGDLDARVAWNRIRDQEFDEAIGVEDGASAEIRGNTASNSRILVFDDAGVGSVLTDNVADEFLVQDESSCNVIRDNSPEIPVDVTQLDEIEGNWAYNDGTTGSEGWAYYDGTEWVTVDTTAL